MLTSWTEHESHLGNHIREVVSQLLDEVEQAGTTAEFDTWGEISKDMDVNVWGFYSDDNWETISIALHPVFDGQTDLGTELILDSFTYLPDRLVSGFSMDEFEN